MLDTSICIYLIKMHPNSLVARVQSMSIEEIAISTMTIAELEYGVANSKYPEANRLSLVEFLSPFEILEFTQAAAFEYGQIRYELKRKGMNIGPMVLLIAAHAVAENLTLVTNNEREFRRVHQLRVENWTRE